MKRLLMAIAGAGLLAGCADDAAYRSDAGGYGASLSMGGGSGVRGVYPDAALYANEFATTNEYAAGLMAGLRSGPSAVGAPSRGTNDILRGGAAGAIEVEPEYFNPFAPTVELIVPSGIASGSTLPEAPQPAPAVTPPPPGEAERSPVPTGPGKPL